MTGIDDRPVGPETPGSPVGGLEDDISGETPVFAILDAAANPKLLDQLYGLRPPFECLYRGELKPDMAHVAPYLALLEPDSEFRDWVVREGWGKHWGVFALADCSLAEMRRHLRRFLTVHTEEGKPLLFRFYDPRVLRVYLPTCTAGELAEFFGPVQAFLTEGESPEEFLRFERADGKLKRKVQPARKQGKWVNPRQE